MKRLKRPGWLLILIGGVLMLGFQSVFGLPFLLLGGPLLFLSYTAEALSAVNQSQEPE